MEEIGGPPRHHRSGATRRERPRDDPIDDPGSHTCPGPANRRRTKRLAPKACRCGHHAAAARSHGASDPRFAGVQVAKASLRQRSAPSGNDRDAKPPDTKPIAASVRTSPRLRSIRLTWGCSGQGVGFSGRACAKLLSWFRNPRSEPVSIIWSLPHQIKLTYGRRIKQPHQHPACGGQGSGERNHSSNRRFRPYRISVRPPGSAETDQVSVDCFNSCRASFRRSSRWPPR